MHKDNVLVFSTRNIAISILLIILLKPAYIALLPGISVIWQGLKLAFCIISLMLYIYNAIKGRRITLVEKVIIIYAIYMLLNSFLRSNYFNIDIDELIVQVSLMMLVSYALSKDYISNLKLIIRIINLYFVLNFITMVLWPHGLYTASNINGSQVNYWLLGNPNPISRFALITLAINIVYSVVTKSKLRKTDFLLALMCIETAIICNSATALIGFLIVILLYLLSYWKRTSRHITVFLSFVVGAILSVLIVIFGVQYKYSSLLSLLGRDVSFTGRTIIWDRATLLISRNLAFGYGYMDKSYLYSILGASHTHNYYLWTLLSGGIIGFLFMGILAFCISHEIKKVIDIRAVKVSLSLIAAFYLMGIAEALTQMPLFFAVFVIVEQLCKNVLNKQL